MPADLECRFVGVDQCGFVPGFQAVLWRRQLGYGYQAYLVWHGFVAALDVSGAGRGVQRRQRR